MRAVMACAGQLGSDAYLFTKDSVDDAYDPIKDAIEDRQGTYVAGLQTTQLTFRISISRKTPRSARTWTQWVLGVSLVRFK